MSACKANPPLSCDRPVTHKVLMYPFSDKPRWVLSCGYHARGYDESRPIPVKS